MVRVAVVAEPPITASAIGEDFATAGFDVVLCEAVDEQLFQAIIRGEPDLVVAVSPTPSDMLLESAALLKKIAPRPFVLFTADASPAKIERGSACGIHSYVIDGYAPRRLRNVAQVALARFRHEQNQDGRLDELARDLRERKQVERAKGLLMRSRGLSEAGAFELMRSLAMRRRMRLANVAEAVINLSIGAEAVNRAGQLRMLAQRLMRCLVQLAHGVQPEWAAAVLRECRERIESNIAQLGRTVGDRGYEADIARIAASWSALRDAADAVGQPDGLVAADAAAEALTRDAEVLTGLLESSGLVTNLRVINLAGRQRMLSQRVGKLCLLLALGEAPPADTAARAAALGEAVAEFEGALIELRAMPVRTEAIDRRLGEAERRWAATLPFGRGQGTADGCVEACESLLDALEALTTAYEEAAQVLIGDRMDPFVAG